MESNYNYAVDIQNWTFQNLRDVAGKFRKAGWRVNINWELLNDPTKRLLFCEEQKRLAYRSVRRFPSQQKPFIDGDLDCVYELLALELFN